MERELPIQRIVINEDKVTFNGKLLAPVQGLFWKQKMAEEQAIWNGAWNGWKPEPQRDLLHEQYLNGVAILERESLELRERQAIAIGGGVTIYGK